MIVWPEHNVVIVSLHTSLSCCYSFIDSTSLSVPHTDPTDPRVETLLRKSIALLEDQVNDEMAQEDLEFYYYNLGTTLLSQGIVEGVGQSYTAAVSKFYCSNPRVD